MNHQDTKTTKVGIAKTSTIGITIMIMIRIMKIQKCFFNFLVLLVTWWFKIHLAGNDLCDFAFLWKQFLF